MKKLRNTARGRAPVKPNIIDQAITYINPAAGFKRLQARNALALVGGYEGGARSRRDTARFNPLGGGPEADLHLDLPTLRARSRDLYRNTPIARGAVNEKVSFVVGAGHIVDPQINRDLLGLSVDQATEWEGLAAQLFRAHARSNDIHAGRSMNFAELEALTLKTTLLSGDMLTFERFISRKGAILSTCVQLVEGDRLVNPNGAGDTSAISGGVKRDADGAPVSYYVLDTHPGEYTLGAANKGEWYPAFAPDGRRRVHHHYFHHRPGQVRGEPFLAPVIASLKQLERYSEAELMAAVINSCFAITSKTENGEGLDLVAETAGDEKQEISLTESGMIVDLAQDESVESFTPGRPSASFDPFFRAIVSQMAVALDTSEEVLMRSFKASYSASRGAIEIAYRFAQSYEAWIISKFCQPVYEAVIAEAVARNILKAPGFFSDPFVRSAWLNAAWTGPARLSLNPKAESDADKLDLEMGITDKYRLAAKRGNLFDNVAENRAKSKRFEESLDIGAPAPTAAPAKSDETDPNDDPADEDSEENND
ncbi:phage portal protein [Hyphococcus sp.]|uniref:phage portal protein n=1 Tax=Hyphococcus sp. TaxID=2038636 RepID=UPI00208151CF|nr:MAG: phage portal protein [Marinicaulis sp.]